MARKKKKRNRFSVFLRIQDELYKVEFERRIVERLNKTWESGPQEDSCKFCPRLAKVRLGIKINLITKEQAAISDESVRATAEKILRQRLAVPICTPDYKGYGYRNKYNYMPCIWVWDGEVEQISFEA